MTTQESGSRSRALVHVTERVLAGPPDNPLALLPAEGPAFAWADPSEGVIIVGSGAALSVQAAGLAEAAQGTRDSASDVEWTGDHPDAVRWVGGCSFAGAGHGVWAGFPPAWFFVPEVTLVVKGETARLVAAGAAAEDAARLLDRAEASLASPDWEPFEPAVESSPGPPAGERASRALEAISTGQVRKVVVSTYRTLVMGSDVSAVAGLAALAALEPSAFHYLVRPPGAATWLGASPERLVAVKGQEVISMALAGTSRRGAAADDDARQAKALIGSPKEREEHAYVVKDVLARLAECGAATSGSPEIRRLERMFHLQSTVRGVRPEGAGVLELGALLHPTAALGGDPRDAALALLTQIEPDGRGWYGGVVGWVNGAGEGDLTVAIRGALVNDRTVTGFAGAGVTAGSDPTAEEAEVALKLDHVLSAFEADPA